MKNLCQILSKSLLIYILVRSSNRFLPHHDWKSPQVPEFDLDVSIWHSIVGIIITSISGKSTASALRKKPLDNIHLIPRCPPHPSICCGFAQHCKHKGDPKYGSSQLLLTFAIYHRQLYPTPDIWVRLDPRFLNILKMKWVSTQLLRQKPPSHYLCSPTKVPTFFQK